MLLRVPDTLAPAEYPATVLKSPRRFPANAPIMVLLLPMFWAPASKPIAVLYDRSFPTFLPASAPTKVDFCAPDKPASYPMNVENTEFPAYAPAFAPTTVVSEPVVMNCAA